MDQLSFFDSDPQRSDSVDFPLTHEDVVSIFNKYVFEGEKDEDVFTWNETSSGKSYYIFGTKVFAHRPGDMKKARLFIPDGDKFITKSSSSFSGHDVYEFFTSLKARKKQIFRALTPETFACCNDFKKCSAAGHCIYPDDRFYNGCIYRTNLEAGKNFFAPEKSEVTPLEDTVL